MRLELLFHRDCPSWHAALRELSAALRALGIDAEPELVEVGDGEEARALRFPGSPTLRLDGEDLFPVPRPHLGLTCRLYLTPGGARGYPSRRMIAEALEKRMPHREGKEVSGMAEKIVDPVCGMEVDPDTAPAKAEYKGKTYYFCAPSCRDEFEKDPERYLPKEGRGCCG